MATHYMQPNMPSYHAFGSHQSGYGPNMVPSKNCGFAFQKRFERLDWRKIAAIDVDQISRTLDFNCLQENIMNITFCNIESEVDVRMIDPNFVKLFRLAQLIIEYLLHSQDYLAGLVATNEEKTKAEKQIQNELKQQIEKLQQELNEVKKESHKRKKLLCAQQQLIHSGPKSYIKCPYCPKAFLNDSFLQSHLNRRHEDSQQNSKTSSGDQHVGSIHRTLEAELRDIKERLKMTEAQLEEERRMINSLKSKEKQISAIQNSDVQSMRYSEDQKENENTQMLMKELKEMNEKLKASERACAEVKAKFGIRSNLGEIEDDVELEKSLLQQQRSEVAMMKEQLQQQMEEMNFKMTNKFEKQERKWQKKVHQITKSHSEHVKKLKDGLVKASTNLSGSGRVVSPELRQQQQDVEELLRQSSEHEKLLETQEKELEQEMQKPVEAPVVRLKIPKSPRRPESPKQLTMIPSDEDDESTTFGTAGSMKQETPYSTLGSTLGELPLGTAQFLEQLRSNNAIPMMKQQFANVLHDNVISRGIPDDRMEISNQVLEHKLHMLRTQRQAYVKKYADFMALRKYFDDLSSCKAREELKKQKRSPRPGNPNQLSSSTPPVMPSPRHVPCSPHTGRINRTTAAAPTSTPSIRVSSPERPKAAPRAATPQKTMHSTGSTTEWTSTQWDSDDSFSDDKEQGQNRSPASGAVSKFSSSSAGGQTSHRSKTPTPSPRPRGQAKPIQIQSKPLNSFDDDSDSDYSFDKVKTQPAPAQPRVIMSVPKLAKSLEMQLSNRNPNKKPAGAVDTVGSIKPAKPKSDILEDLDFSLGSDEEEKSPPKRRPGTRDSHVETDLSTNTYGTSAWGSSSKAATSVDHRSSKNQSGRNSFTSVSDDEDLNLENI